jgi:1-deoxy-D-xylulose-5-phosphate reductoisomerase
VFNAANEQAVYAFHRGEISLPGIIDTIAHVLEHHESGEMTVEAVLEAERAARSRADQFIASRRA